ncbi:TIR domain-containing protein [Amycolatopsis sp. NPDC051071]|uniref:TIR domain-containing protein n=1 Tax=Amycolatopsis sp. NPDC051071 TaxID=3154637 RepID=UPI003423BB12
MYEYHVFISYQRSSPTVPVWVRNHFYPRLRELMDDLVDYDVKIFLDDQVPVGGEWPELAREALRRARILIPVCSPKYFNDEWCMAEWRSMEKREALVGTGTREWPGRLIYPVIFSDSKNFPEFAHQRRMRSLKTWNLPYPHYQNTAEYIDFHREMERVVEELVEIISQVPEWCSEWPVEEAAPVLPKPSKLPRF